MTIQDGRDTSSAPGGRRVTRTAQVERVRRQRRLRRILLATGCAVILAIGCVFAIRSTQAAPSGTGVAEAADSSHVDEGTAITYAHYPPSPGKHYPVPQLAGVYRTEVPEGYWVHSLQHGYVVVLLKCADGCPDTYRQLTNLYNGGLPASRSGNVKLVVTVTPYGHPFSDPGKDAPITLLAWDREEMLQQFDRDRIVAFYRAYVDKGPEVVP
jgi:hypothetical protein